MKKESLKRIKDRIEWMISDELDFLTDKETDVNKLKAVDTYMLIRSYIAFLKGTSKEKTVFSFIKTNYEYTIREIRIFQNRLIKELFESGCFELPLMEKPLLSYFLEDTLLLIRKVLTQSLIDPHYSGVIAINRLYDYLIVTENGCGVETFMLKKGYLENEVEELKVRIVDELNCWYGRPDLVINLREIFPNDKRFTNITVV